MAAVPNRRYSGAGESRTILARWSAAVGALLGARASAGVAVRQSANATSPTNPRLMGDKFVPGATDPWPKSRRKGCDAETGMELSLGEAPHPMNRAWTRNLALLALFAI